MSNPYNNEIIFNGQTLMSLKEDTVTPDKVLAGETFHDRSGAPQTGNLITHNVYDGLDSTSTSDALSANKGRERSERITLLNSNATFTPEVNTEVARANTILNGIRYGKVCKITFTINITVAGSGWTTVATIPSEYLPAIQQYGICAIDNTVSAGEGKIAEMRVTTTGAMQIYSPIAQPYWGGIEYICS